MTYPPHYTAAITLLRRVQAAIEREEAVATGEHRTLVAAVQERTEAALRSPLLLIDRGYAESAAAQAQADLDVLGAP